MWDPTAFRMCKRSAPILAEPDRPRSLKSAREKLGVGDNRQSVRPALGGIVLVRSAMYERQITSTVS
jgi:hypothetical protein